MTSSDIARISNEVRRAYSSGEDASSPDLTRDVERSLFLAGAIGPVEWIVRDAVGQLKARDAQLPLSDVDVYATWQSAVSHAHLSHLHSGGSSSNDLVQDFISACGRTFGIEASSYPVLLREFHALEHRDRIGIFMLIEKSPTFTYLTREIDECDDPAIEAGAPDPAMRKLMKRILSVESPN